MISEIESLDSDKISVTNDKVLVLCNEIPWDTINSSYFFFLI